MRAPLVAIMIALAFTTADASPPSKAACTVACQADIAACAVGGRAARCRRQIVRRCRRRGFSACAAVTTTTSTTTTTTHSTTTSTTHATTTTTTSSTTTTTHYGSPSRAFLEPMASLLE